MMTKVPLLLVPILSSVNEINAHNHHDMNNFFEPDNPWIAPGPDDVRSPCPFVNTMANHGKLKMRKKEML